MPEAGSDGDCPFVLCHGVCTDVFSDSTHCGVCDHDCQGTTCTGGLCLARGIAVGSGPVQLVVDSTYVYFTDTSGTVKRVPSGGGTTVNLASAIPSPFGVAVDATYVYFTSSGTFAAGFDDGAVFKVPISSDGGAPSSPIPLATGRPSPQNLIVDDTQVYWLEPGSAPTNGALLACPLSGCIANTPQVLADTLASPWALALDSTSVYVTASGGGQVLAVDKSTGTLRVIAGMEDQPEGIAVANGKVYWASTLAGAIRSAPTDGDGGIDFIAVTMGSPQAVAADAVHVYWSDTHPLMTFGPLEECSILGCTPATALRLIDLDAMAKNIAIDSLFVYWIDGTGQILRVAK